MKLVRHGPLGAERPGFLDEQGLLRDLSGHMDDIAGEVLSRHSLRALSRVEPHTCPILPSATRLGACVGRVGKFICIGLNYADHAAESGADVPTEPVIFLKATTAICGSCDNIIQPRDFPQARLGSRAGRRDRRASKGCHRRDGARLRRRLLRGQ